MIIGADEVGYGAIAHSVMVCAFRASDDWSINNLNDSKKLSEEKREFLYEKLIIEPNISFTVAFRTNNYIDEFGLGKALKECYEEAIQKLIQPEDIVIIDGNLKWENKQYKSVIKADSSVKTVMAASVIAKVTRDREMIALSSKYPNYSFEKHKGYGTKLHKDAIRKFGFCDLHRKSYNIKL